MEEPECLHRTRLTKLMLIEVLRKLTGLEPKMWGPTIIGFGSYHYKYESGHEGDSPILGFSPRKAETSLYIHSQTPKSKDLLSKLGKFRLGKVCIYIKRLSDIDLEVLLELAIDTILYIQENNVCSCKIKLA